MAWWRGIAVAAMTAVWLAAGADRVAAGPQEEIEALVKQVQTLRDAGKNAEALPLAEKAFAIAEQKLGPDSEAAIAPLVNIGAIKVATILAGQDGFGGPANQADWDKAEALFRRTLALREKYPGEDKRPSLGKILLALGVVYSSQKKFGDSDRYFGRYFEYAEARITAKKMRPDDSDLSQALSMQATADFVRTRTGDLQKLYQRMIALSEQHLGYDHPYTGVQIAQLALFLGMLQGPASVEPLNERFVAIAKKAFEDPGTDLGPSVTREDLMAKLNRAAAQMMAAGKPDKAQEALAIVREARAAPRPQPGQQTAEAGTDPDALAKQADEVEKWKGRTQALPLRKRIAALRQQALAANPGDANARAKLATACQQLADYYFSVDLANDAEPMFKCVLLIREMEGSKLKIAAALDNMGNVLERLGRFGEAEEALKRAIVLIEEVKGADTTDASPLRIRVAELMAKQGHAEEGVKFASANPAAGKKLFARPPGKRDALADLDNWGADPAAQKRYSVMEWRGMELDHKLMDMLGPDTPGLVSSLFQTSALFLHSKDLPNAAALLNRAAKIAIASLKRGGRSEPASEKDPGSTAVFTQLVKVGHRLATVEPASESKLRGNLFVMAQWAQHSAAAGALAQMAARPQSDPALAKLARERQDLANERREMDARLFAAVSLSAEARRQQEGKDREMRQRVVVIGKRIEEIDAALLKRFPRYAELVNPTPLSAAKVQRLLKPAEALVLFLDTPSKSGEPGETIAWVVTNKKVQWARIGLGGAAMAEAVFALRCGLDAAAWRDDGAAACEKAVKAKNEYPDKPLPYDLERAYKLYQGLFGPFADLIKGKRLLIAASGSLTSLPLQALVTEKPAEALPGWEGYHGVKWLGREHAVSVLPSVPSLSVLRQEAKAEGAPEPFVGYGDPALDGNPKCSEAQPPKTCPGEGAPEGSAPAKRGWAARSLGAYFRGGLGDVSMLRQLCPLPEAAVELGCVAKSLHARVGRVLTGSAATETAVKHAHLHRYRVLHFATHGLLAGQTASLNGGVAEPALVLTPPQKATGEDDGLLTASEITQLKLNADWIVLSACNTASGEETGAEALSGLARAFFYAGAKSLLVSHWEVDSYAATMLTTTAFKELSVRPDIGPAKALQRSQAALIDDAERPWNAHPSFWAPFVLVGEGTRGGARTASAGGAAPASPWPVTEGAARRHQARGAKPKTTSPAAARKKPPAH
jgi:CHAT domain-containing protein